MSGRNVDFLAVFLIAVVMLGFSKMASLRFPADAMDSVQMQNAVSVNSCPLQIENEVLSRIAYILNQ
jgi:Tfp pilus assembly protein PilV